MVEAGAKGDVMAVLGLIFAAALAAQGNGAAATAPTAAATPVATAKSAEPKKICVSEAQLGSNFKKRICATAEEWERRRLRDEDEMSKMRDRASACSGSAC